MDLTIIRDDRAEGGRKDVLEGVFGIFGGSQDLATEPQQARVIPSHKGSKGLLIALPEQRYQLLI